MLPPGGPTIGTHRHAFLHLFTLVSEKNQTETKLERLEHMVAYLVWTAESILAIDCWKLVSLGFQDGKNTTILGMKDENVAMARLNPFLLAYEFSQDGSFPALGCDSQPRKFTACNRSS